MVGARHRWRCAGAAIRLPGWCAGASEDRSKGLLQRRAELLPYLSRGPGERRGEERPRRHRPGEELSASRRDRRTRQALLRFGEGRKYRGASVVPPAGLSAVARAMTRARERRVSRLGARGPTAGADGRTPKTPRRLAFR